MKCYVLNLERAVERRQESERQFDQYGIEFEFFAGVDWRDLSEQDILENVHPKYLSNQRKQKQPLIHGTLACWLSHRKIWEKAVKDEQEVIAVFEDDCRISSNTKPALIAIEELSEDINGFDYDMIFLYHGKPRIPIIPVYRLNENLTLGVPKRDSIGAVGYVITRRAMKILLHDFPLLPEIIDILMHSYWIHGLKTFVISPQVVFHGDHAVQHHSFNEEAYNNEEYAKELGYKSSNHTRHGHRLRLREKVYLLFHRRIPRRLAFRKRMKIEQFRLD